MEQAQKDQVGHDRRTAIRPVADVMGVQEGRGPAARVPTVLVTIHENPHLTGRRTGSSRRGIDRPTAAVVDERSDARFAQHLTRL